MSNISVTDFVRACSYIENNFGIDLKRQNARGVAKRLDGILSKYHCRDFDEFIGLLNDENASAITHSVAEALTRKNNLWFRDTHPFVTLQEIMLPDRLANVPEEDGAPGKVRIWAGAISEGQGAYSLAIAVAEFCRERPDVSTDRFEIIGTDSSADTLEHARAGRYSRNEVLSEVDPDRVARYFTQDGKEMVVNDEVREMIDFRQLELHQSPANLGRLDIVFLRYVSIYLSETYRKKLFSEISGALAPRGFLILGAIESLRGVVSNYETCTGSGGFYYRKHE